MRTLKIAFAVFTVFAVAVLSLALLGVTVWMFPNAVITPSTLEAVQSYFLPEWQVDWQKVNVDVESHSFWRKEIEVGSDGVCAVQPKRFELCFDRIYLRASVDLSSMQDPLVFIDSLILEDQKITVYPVESPRQEEEETNPLQKVQEALLSVSGVLRKLRIGRLDVELSNIQLPQQTLNGLEVDISSGDQADSPVVINAAAEGTEGLLISAEIEKSDYQIGGSWELNADYRDSLTRLEGKVSSQMAGGRIEEARIQLRGSRKFRFDGRTIDVWVKTDSPLQMTDGDMSLRVDTVTVEDRRSQAVIVLRGCEGSIDLSARNAAGEAGIQCPNNYVDLSSLELKEHLVERLPDRLNFSAGVRLQDGQLAYSIDFESYSGPVFAFDMSSSGVLPLPMGIDALDIERFMARLKVKKFNVVVSQLRKTFDFVVPVPFNRLLGDVEVEVAAENWRAKTDARIPLSVKMDLARDETALKMDYHGFVTYLKPTANWHAGGEMIVRKLKFVMPSFDPLYGFPALTADSRIHPSVSEDSFRREVAEAENPAFTYSIRVKTQKEDAIRIYYYLAKPYIPVSLNLLVRNGRFNGIIKLDDFQLTYIKKSISVESLSLDVNEELSESTMNAVFTAERGAYSLRLELVGDVDSPQFYLTSQPELSTQEILALLLYNKMPSRLTEQQNQDASELNAALADHAIGLLGAWALSSVPIDSISYNPSTKTYSAQVNLPSEITLSIGSDWENLTGVELAKRVGMNWFLVSSYEPNDEEASEARMMLEWRKAY